MKHDSGWLSETGIGIGFSVKLSYYSCCFSAGNTELIIKEGPTSALMSLEVIGHPANQLQPLRYREHVAPVTSGFHVSLRGTFGPSSHLAIAYAAFSYMGKCVLDDDKTRGSCLIPMPSIYVLFVFDWIERCRLLCGHRFPVSESQVHSEPAKLRWFRSLWRQQRWTNDVLSKYVCSRVIRDLIWKRLYKH